MLGIAEEGLDLLQVRFKLGFIVVRLTKQMQVTAQHSRELVGQLSHQSLLWRLGFGTPLVPADGLLLERQIVEDGRLHCNRKQTDTESFVRRALAQITEIPHPFGILHK